MNSLLVYITHLRPSPNAAEELFRPVSHEAWCFFRNVYSWVGLLGDCSRYVFSAGSSLNRKCALKGNCHGDSAASAVHFSRVFLGRFSIRGVFQARGSERCLGRSSVGRGQPAWDWNPRPGVKPGEGRPRWGVCAEVGGERPPAVQAAGSPACAWTTCRRGAWGPRARSRRRCLRRGPGPRAPGVCVRAAGRVEGPAPPCSP